MKKKHWYDYLWIATSIYLILGFFNILFAYLGMICFILPLIISFKTHSKIYCNKYCGRGQLLQLLGDKIKIKNKKTIPSFFYSKFFRYGFLIFFMTMFSLMVHKTYLVFINVNDLKQVLKLLWTFKIKWDFATPNLAINTALLQYAFGFYSIMITSTLIGLILMLFFKPRSWCLFCPMGTMTQGICKIKSKKKM